MSVGFEFSAALGTTIVTVLDYFGGFTHLIFKQLTPKKKEEISSQSNNSTGVFIEVFFKFTGNKTI